MTAMLDLHPAAQRMATLLENVSDDQLGATTPCPDYTLGDLVDHVGGLALAFTLAATKNLGSITSQAPSPDASHLGHDWRTRFSKRLDELADAWSDPDAWTGMTRAGGVDLPGDVAGQVALNELVVHGWDVARASGQDYECEQAELEACLQFLSASQAEGSESSPFGPAVDVPADAPLLDRVIGLSGRSPSWQPS